MSYVYDGAALYFHCAKSGHKLDAIESCDTFRFIFCLSLIVVKSPVRTFGGNSLYVYLLEIGFVLCYNYFVELSEKKIVKFKNIVKHEEAVMNTLSELCGKFFHELKLDGNSNLPTSSNDKLCFEKSIDTFLKSGQKEDAFVVYLCFCEIFNIFGQGYTNTKKLLEMLSDHEYHSGELLAKHRDHYSHSVYVFALGLAVYANDASYRQAFSDYCGGGADKNAYYFLKYWGLASLFHDIGYPFELAHAQVKTYCEEIWGNDDGNLYISYGNLDKFIAIEKDVAKRLKKTFKADNSFSTINKLLAYGLNVRMGYEPNAVEKILKERVISQKYFMDHAYFSAALLAKKLFSVADFELTMPYLDVLTAILLHNSFNKYEAPGRRPVAVSDHPLCYLLILCDELQSWDRLAYGKISKRDPIAWDVRLDISDRRIAIKYIFDSFINRANGEENANGKVVYNKNYNEITDGTFVAQIMGTDYVLANGGVHADNLKHYAGYIVPNLDLSVEAEEEKKEKKISLITSDNSFINLYDLAKLIHVSYNEHCKGMDGTRVDEDFGRLPLEFKISNIDLAKSYAAKLERINCFYSSKDLDYPIVTDINNLIYGNYKNNREFLCREEHVRWVKEKLALGWKYGTDYTCVEGRNRKKIHKCIVPYEQLSDEEKSKDALMIEGIFTQLHKLESNVKIYNYPMGHKPKIEIAGVGHRYIATDPELIKSEVKRCLQKYSETNQVVVRTCFACGADQIIAECALELGLTVKAVIPLEYEAYIADVKADAISTGHAFTEQDELKMRHLLAQTVVCKPVIDSVHRYEAASKYIIDKCNVLIAIWDGKEMPLFDENKSPINRGGTYDSIRIAQESGKKVYVIKCSR